jgi:hypothetical protein
MLIIIQAAPLTNITINILDNYGLLTEVMARDHAQTYMFFYNRAAQDSHNMYHCLEASLTPEARQILYSEQAKYTFRRADATNAPQVPNSDPEEKRRDGLMFLWCIIDRTTATTNATISTILRMITHLREIMVEKDSNVTAFNTNVCQLVNSYYANKREQVDSETSLYNLFEAYLICKDQDFVT